MGKKFTKLAVFDFDGTLVRTAVPSRGKDIWKEKKNSDWPHKGWWAKKESLDIDVFDNDVVEEVIESYMKEKSSESTLMVMMTGRVFFLSEHVEKILEKHQLHFDRRYYNTGGSTMECKLKTLNELLVEFPDIEEIEMWDDRPLHVPEFQAWGDEQKQKFKINLVEGWEE